MCKLCVTLYKSYGWMIMILMKKKTLEAIADIVKLQGTIDAEEDE